MKKPVSEEDMAQAAAKVSSRYSKSVNCFLTEGFSETFYLHLRRYVHHLYANVFQVNESWDYYYDKVREKLETLLGVNEDGVSVYDPSKGTLVTLIYTVAYNERTKSNSKNKRNLYIDSPEHEYLASNLTRPNSHAMTDLREQYLAEAASRGIDLSKEYFFADLNEGKLTPHVFAYLWMYQMGGRHGLSV